MRDRQQKKQKQAKGLCRYLVTWIALGLALSLWSRAVFSQNQGARQFATLTLHETIIHYPLQESCGLWLKLADSNSQYIPIVLKKRVGQAGGQPVNARDSVLGAELTRLSGLGYSLESTTGHTLRHNQETRVITRMILSRAVGSRRKE